MKKVKRVVALIMVITCMVALPVHASESVYATTNNHVLTTGTMAGLIDFNIYSFVYYDSNTASSVYIDRSFSRISNNSAYSVVTGIYFKLYNGSYSYYDVYPYSLGPLEAGENSYGFKYYRSTLSKTGSTPCVVTEIMGETNLDGWGGGHVIYFTSSDLFAVET